MNLTQSDPSLEVEIQLEETLAFLSACARIEAAEVAVILKWRAWQEYLKLVSRT